MAKVAIKNYMEKTDYFGWIPIKNYMRKTDYFGGIRKDGLFRMDTIRIYHTQYSKKESRSEYFF